MMEQVELPRRVIFMRIIAELGNNSFRMLGSSVHMRRLAAHQSVGNLYEDVHRNDNAAGVIPRIVTPVDCASIT